jgi:hypothetical protein
VNSKVSFRLAAPLAALAASALACAMIAAFGPGGRALAQETDLPGVSADSMHKDFLNGSKAVPAPPATANGITPPAAPEAPEPTAAPTPPRGPEDPQTAAFRRRIHAGDNDVVQVGQDVVVERGEHVLGHVFAMGGNITVRGMVDDDVVAMGGDVTLEDGAQVRGDVVSLGGTVHKASTAVITGSNVTVGGLPKRFWDFRTLDFVGNGVKFLTRLVNLVFWLFVGWVVIQMAAERSRRVLARIEERPALSIGIGFLGLLALVPATVAVALVAVLLIVTIIGIPVAAILILGYVLAVCAVVIWGAVVSATAIGNWIVARLAPRLGEPTLVRSTVIGMVAVGVLPLVGPLFKAVGIAIPPAALLGGTLTAIGHIIQCLAVLAGIGGVLAARAGQIEPIRMPWGGRVTPGIPTTPPAPPAAPAV